MIIIIIIIIVRRVVIQLMGILLAFLRPANALQMLHALAETALCRLVGTPVRQVTL